MNELVDHDWSIDLEHGEYEENQELVIQDALQAVERTSPGYYVNLVTPNGFGTPEEYLDPLLHELYGEKIKTRFIDQCGCGGYVLRVWKI
ncbi:MAG TPA: CGCGG family rSAM-modified RiPP protein [Bacillota bacterium]|nr:CGCGG family rSAM-modified RiPP protein [Bacillota bacterium]